MSSSETRTSNFKRYKWHAGDQIIYNGFKKDVSLDRMKSLRWKNCEKKFNGSYVVLHWKRWFRTVRNKHAKNATNKSAKLYDGLCNSKKSCQGFKNVLKKFVTHQTKLSQCILFLYLVKYVFVRKFAKQVKFGCCRGVKYIINLIELWYYFITKNQFQLKKLK